MPKPKLPSLLDRKLYKTGQTRGADDDQIFQNRVNRNGTVLIPYSQYDSYKDLMDDGFTFENGFIVLVSPSEYFTSGLQDRLIDKGLEIGINSLLFYETRSQWINYNPSNYNMVPATSRISPLGGQYVARVAATTSVGSGGKINEGFTTTSLKGAGIRVYEYASSLVC